MMDKQPTDERDTHFAGFAMLLLEDMFDIWHRSSIDFTRFDQPECLAVQQVIARRAYDLMYHACWMINNAQFKSGGVRLHPNAMMRAIEDLTAWPNDSAPGQ